MRKLTAYLCKDMNLSLKCKEKEELPSSELILSVSHLKKKYDDFYAVDDISFSVKRGSLFAFLGLNGAGKSTTINIITGILSKNEGKIIFDGKDMDEYRNSIKSEIGIVFQNSVLDPVLTPKENLTLRAGFYGIKGQAWKDRLKVLSDMLGLQEFMDRPVGKLSGGQKRRVDIARAMVHDPKLLILDEPTTGLDPQTRKAVWNLVNSLRQKTGMTVFLTTHYMEEAEKATYVVIMNSGKIIAQGTPNSLKKEYAKDYIIIHQKKDEGLEKRLAASQYSFSYFKDSETYRVPVSDSSKAIAFIEEFKDVLSDFEVEKGDMDDVFLNATGVAKLLEDSSDE